MSERLCFVDTHHQPVTNDFPRTVAEGLSHPQKTLPCRYFYDARGSALFEQICDLPEYYVTRTEASILYQYAAEIVASLQNETALVEFGSGSSCKTRFLLDALLQQQTALHYTSIDISRDFLRESAYGLLSDYSQLKVTALAAEYHTAIECLPPPNLPRLFLFLGSNLGNFETAQAIRFLQRLRGAMQPNDRLLLGVDLVKNRETLEAAYNDAQGITAAFNTNLLHRINRELNADFDTAQFAHAAPFVADRSRIEMHLVSKKAQSVHIKALRQTFTFDAGESIHTENSHKYTRRSVGEICAQAGLAIEESWTDSEQGFAALLICPDKASRVHSSV